MNLFLNAKIDALFGDYHCSLDNVVKALSKVPKQHNNINQNGHRNINDQCQDTNGQCQDKNKENKKSDATGEIDGCLKRLNVIK